MKNRFNLYLIIAGLFFSVSSETLADVGNTRTQRIFKTTCDLLLSAVVSPFALTIVAADYLFPNEVDTSGIGTPPPRRLVPKHPTGNEKLK